MKFDKRNLTLKCLTCAAFIALLGCGEQPHFSVTLKIQNHLFFPDVVEFPKHTKVALRIINLDQSAEEFESDVLNKEKIIPGNAETLIIFDGLEAGEYPFYGEFNPVTATGVILVK